tara:strand:- start:500 stop:967 length:468 start_codon:yes stop_codon:yes gene_type:complete
MNTNSILLKSGLRALAPEFYPWKKIPVKRVRFNRLEVKEFPYDEDQQIMEARGRRQKVTDRCGPTGLLSTPKSKIREKDERAAVSLDMFHIQETPDRDDWYTLSWLDKNAAPNPSQGSVIQQLWEEHRVHPWLEQQLRIDLRPCFDARRYNYCDN